MEFKKMAMAQTDYPNQNESLPFGYDASIWSKNR